MTNTPITPNPYPDNVVVGGWTDQGEEIVSASWDGEINDNEATFGVIQPDFIYEFQAGDDQILTLHEPTADMMLEILMPLTMSPLDSTLHTLNEANPQITIPTGARFLLITPADSRVEVVYTCEYTGSLPWLKF